jgi:hypothetical protein
MINRRLRFQHAKIRLRPVTFLSDQVRVTAWSRVNTSAARR